jgi:hypothetical protein
VRVAVSGHRGLSAPVEALIATEVDREPKRIAPNGIELTGLSCLADGADQIFAAAVLAHGGTLEAIVPAAEYRSGLPDSAKRSTTRVVAMCPGIIASTVSTSHAA